MRDFVITTDSTVDLPKEYLSQTDIVVLPLAYIIGDKTYQEDGSGLTPKEFYDALRNGAMPTTSQINPEQAQEAFEKILKEGKDIIHIGFSSALSGSYNSARIAAQELQETYPDAKIYTLDSLSASLGEGLLVYKLYEMKKAGKTIDEIYAWGKENHLHVCHNFTVDDLHHLHRGGRVSKASAVIGSIINIKPVLVVNDAGKLIPMDKVRGRKKSLIELVNRMEKQIQGFENDIFMVSHGDCIEDAEFVANLVKERFGIEKVIINEVGAVIGSHAGAGTVALFFMGAER